MKTIKRKTKKVNPEEEIINKMEKFLSKKFPKYVVEVKTTSDDGGKLVEIHADSGQVSRAIRDALPLKWEGWRTVVINRYAVSGAE
jgi:hypothetical protein